MDNATDDAHWGPYERLRPDQIEAIRAAVPIAYVPWGALEYHSYHNPIGLDGLQAHGQCRALAETTGGVVLPPFYVGTDTIKPYKGFPHSIEHAASTVRALCRDVLAQLADEAFRVVVIVTGHCGEDHVAALRAEVDAFTERQDAVGALLIPAFDPMEDTYAPNHAAWGETALQLLFDPEPVDLTRLPADRVATLDEDGVWGDDPRSATAEDGAAILKLFVDRTAPRIRGLLDRHGR